SLIQGRALFFGVNAFKMLLLFSVRPLRSQ
ncbi:MAG: hypothetical protein ACI8WB_003289, partial [Phenylobacterium sp.]